MTNDNAVEQVTPATRPGNRFKPGHAKFGGRKKGVPTRQTWLARRIAEAENFDPVKIAISVVRDGVLPSTGKAAAREVSIEERLKCLRDLLGYLMPRLSAVQVTGNDGGPVAIAALDVTQLMADPALAAMAQTLSLAATAQTTTYNEPLDDPDQ